MPTEREACGLGALLPVSCRGRAESFARRLHTRLRSLGGGGAGGLGGSTDLLRGTDDEEEGLDLAGAMGGWGMGGGGGGGEDEGEAESEAQAGNGEASGEGRGAEGGCSSKYRSTDRGSPGTVTVQQPHPTAGPVGHSPSPPTGSSPPYSSSPRPRLDSGLESLGSPTSGTPPRPGSNGSESGVAGINTPANGYFSPPNDAGFSSGRWHASPSPDRDLQTRSPLQRPNRRRRDIRWPPAHPVEAATGEGEAALPNFLECYPQTGVDSPPETTWSPSSMSPENGVGGGMRFHAAGGGDEVDGRSAGESYWNHYSYFRHGHPARSPATPPPLQSPDLLPLNSKGLSSPTSYTPPCSPMSPVETPYEPLNSSPTLAMKSPISEVNEEDDGTEESETQQLLPEDTMVPVLNQDLKEPDIEITNCHSSEELPEEIAEISNPSIEPVNKEIEVDLLSFDLKLVHLSSVEPEEERKIEDEEQKSEDDDSSLQTESNQEGEKAEKSGGEEEDALSEDSMERDIQSLAETIYGKGAGKEGMEESEGEVENQETADLKPPGEGQCSPEEETADEAELRRKYLDADSSDMDLKAVRIICEEMASRAMKMDANVIIIGVTDEDQTEEVTKEPESEEVKEKIKGHVEEDDRTAIKGHVEEDDRRAAKGHMEEDEEEEMRERVPRVRRSTSLKTGKTPPGTPSRKKIVRFADVLGLDLADVRTFLDEIPHVPRSAFQDLAPEASFDPVAIASHWEIGSTTIVASRRPRRYHLTPLFPQPGAAADFMDRIRERCICLESAMEEDMDDEEDDGGNYFGVNGWSVLGTVRVRNIAFHKSVHARASADGWRSHADVSASYLPGSCDGFSDRFAFEIRPGIPPTGGGLGAAPFPRRLPNGGRLEFAVRFQCQGSQYWDNNAGANYVFSVEPLANPALPARKPEEEERSPATPAPNPRTRTQAFHYLSLPSPDSDWATFL